MNVYSATSQRRAVTQPTRPRGQGLPAVDLHTDTLSGLGLGLPGSVLAAALTVTVLWPKDAKSPTSVTTA
jgi:hypothetical protein